MTIYYIDHDAKEGQLTGTLTFTNGSTTVTGTGTLFTTELSVGDYIISDDATNGVEWYKVTAITDDVTLTIDHAFYQATHSATASYNKQSNVTGGGTATTYDSVSGVGPFCHIQQFLDVAVAGDVAYVRANKTYYYSMVLDPLNDGTETGWIKLIGDDGTQFGDTFTSRAVVDFQNGGYGSGRLATDCAYFEINNIDFRNYPLYAGLIDINDAPCIVRNCKIYASDGVRDSYEAINVYTDNGYVLIENCEIADRTTGIGGVLGIVYVVDTVFNNISNCISPGGYNGYRVYGRNLTVNSSGYIVAISGNSYIKLKGITTDGTLTDYITSSPTDGSIAYVYIDDVDGEQVSLIGSMLVRRDTLTYTGTATDSVKVTVTTDRFGKTLSEHMPVFEWVIDGVTGGVSHTVSVDVIGSGWTTLPTADELWIEVEYYDQTTGTHTAIAKSTDVLTANDTWTTFSVTFTPAQDGRVYVRGYLKKYEAGAAVWFNGEVNIT